MRGRGDALSFRKDAQEKFSKSAHDARIKEKTSIHERGPLSPAIAAHICDAMISPAVGGTKAVEPGTALPVSGSVMPDFMGSSREYTTFKAFIPLLRHSVRITRARGHTDVS